MSTILKALRRLEEDKRTQAAMSLDEAVLDPARPAGNRRGIGVSVAAGVMAALGVIAIAWSLSGLLLPASEGAPAPLAPQRDMQVAKREAAEPPEVPEAAWIYNVFSSLSLRPGINKSDLMKPRPM